MGAKSMKLITVPLNGQISIGKAWAGRQIRVEEINENEIHISSGTFIPDSQRAFFTRESMQALKDFDKWVTQNPNPKESAQETLNRLKKQRKPSGK